ncbi:MAG TPA: hypothetical protein VFT99_12330, partial [Roseiflexaceae bacterium]|nr:hypothetical protein [Roseiflexaceae bacterium]
VLFTASHQAAAADPDLDIDITADKLELKPGDTVGIKIHFTNSFTATLKSVIVKLEYDSSQLTPIGSDFQRDTDWVSELSDRRVFVTFQDIEAGRSRSGKVLFRVNQPQPGNTTVPVFGKYEWQTKDDNGFLLKDGSGSKGGPDALIVAPDGVLTDPNIIDSQPRVWIEPTVGGPGITFHAYASGFTAGEQVSIWLNTPIGPQAVPHELYANATGEVWPQFSGDGLAPGNYGLVIYGTESTQTLVVPFSVSPAAAAAPGPPPVVAAPPPTNINPRVASADTTFHAYARGFRAGESVSIWLNGPNGEVIERNGGFAVNDAGETWPEFDSGDLAPGAYTLVVYGRDSAFTAVIPFTVNS